MENLNKFNNSTKKNYQKSSAAEKAAPRSTNVRRQDHQLQYNSSKISTPISHPPTPLRQMCSASISPTVQQKKKKRNRGSATRLKSDSFTSDDVAAVSCSPSSSQSPWVRRRLGLDSVRSSPMPSADNRLSGPTNIVRMPRGPDGTRGFHRSAAALENPLKVTL